MTPDQARLDTIADAVGSLERYCADVETAAPADDVMRGFLLHVTANIGASAAKLSAALKARHTDVPWQDVIAMWEFSSLDHAPDAERLKKALSDTLPRLSSRLYDLASDAAHDATTSPEPAGVSTEAEDPGLDQDGAVSLDDVRARRMDIERIAAQYGASNIRIFGSVARGEAKPYSDIDFLVDMEPGRSLFDLGGLQMDLQRLFGRPVDVSHPRQGKFRDRITAEAVPL